MALLQNKRRKVEHVSSPEDVASFASFGDSDAEQSADEEVDVVDLDGADGGEESGDDADEADMDDGLDDGAESEEGKEEEDETVAQAQAGRMQQTASTRDRTRTTKSTAEAAGGAYSAGTFKSNMFKLQVDELLEQIRPRRGKREEAAEQALHALKKTIDQAPARQPLSVDEAERQLLMSSKVAIPFPSPRPPRDAKYKLEFAAPSAVNVVGSYALKTNSRSKNLVGIDMMVVMPSSLLQEKDYLNHRYFYKRSYYLACLAAALKDAHGSSYELRFKDFHGDHLKPILVVTARPDRDHGDTGKPAPSWRINLIPCAASNVFPKEKLSPEKNCVRPDGDTKPMPTTFYNSSLRADMLMASYLKLLHGAASTSEAFRDACLLGNTWLRQRGYGSNIALGGFGSFEWSSLMALLLQGGGPNGKPTLSTGYSSYQLFKATLQVLAVKDLSKQALIIGDGSVKSVGDGSPMAWDDARAHNVLYNVTPWAYNRLRQDSQAALTMLGDQLFDGFEATFILRVDNPLMRYDHVIELPSFGLHRTADSTAAREHQKLYDVLKRGLGDRVSQVSCQAKASAPWRIGSARPAMQKQGCVTVGLVVNPDAVNRTVDHGPPAESKADAASFRGFWGEKAELRRFKDGSILESLVWSANDGGKGVLEQIVRFLLSRHFSDTAERDAVFAGSGFARLLRGGTATAAFQPIMEAYKKLEMDIRGLEGLPLSVRQIMPADPQLRYAFIHTPSGTPAQQQPMPANITIQFEGSARWPDDLVAIQRTKIAFLLKLGELLQESDDITTARIGLENQDHDILNQAYLDIVYDSNAAFRMRIHHDREQTLLERQLKDKLIAPSAREAAALGLAAYKREYIKAPAHTQAIAQLCSRYPSLSGVIRLLKKWFASHLLANHVADEVVELIAVRTFVQPWPWQTPSSVQTGFLRTLHWLSRWDWRHEPLVVDLSGSGELKQSDFMAVRTRFEAWRKLDPSLNRTVLFAASNLDPEGTTWTDGRPHKVIAGRMTALAKAACAEIDEKALELEPASLLASSLSDYDFVLHLKPSSGGKKRKGVTNGTTFKNLEMATLNDETMIGFDAPQLFLDELESLYGSAVLFFSGGRERLVIAGLWSPLTAPRGWKVNLAYSTMPTKPSKAGETMAEMNKEAMLAEMARLGGDLVENVEMNRH